MFLIFTSQNRGQGITRPSTNPEELTYWLKNMIVHHDYSLEEVQQVSGLE